MCSSEKMRARLCFLNPKIMKKLLLIAVAALFMCSPVWADITDKLSASTQLFIAERDGLISLDEPVIVSSNICRAPLKNNVPMYDRTIAAAEEVNGVSMVPAFIHINSSNTAEIERLGVIVQEQFNGFVTALIPVDMIESVAAVADVKEIKVAQKLRKLTDRSRSYTNADDVIYYSADAVAAGLPQAFTGKGVVVGVIDGGIDFQHAMFNDSTGNTRIKVAYIAKGQETLTKYSDISSLTTDDTGESHGTHTSTTAGGSSLTVDGVTYGGMAPESELVLVGLGDYMYNTNIANAIKYVYEYAEAQGMPSVTSLSLGSHFGPHDGTGELASVYSQYNGNNHIIVYAASNDAGGSDGSVHVEGTASSTTPLTAAINSYAYSSSQYLYYGYSLWYARTKDTKLACKLHVINKSTKSILWTSSAITSTTSSVSGITSYLKKSPTVTISQDTYNSKYYVQIYYGNGSMYATNSNYALAVSVYPTSGSCTIDGWDVYGYNTISNSISGTIGGYTFVAADDNSCISDEAASNDVISVGAYATRSTVSDYNGTSYNLGYTIGDIAYFSSYQVSGYGPTGETKPDICAPGAGIIAGINHYDTDGYMSNAYASYNMPLVYNSTNSSLGCMDGTSMATPCVAGIIAQYLQAAVYAGKTLDAEGIRDVFKNTAITDSYTSQVNFGKYGKINALAGVKYILGTDPTLTATPSELTFSTIAGNSEQQTFTVKGARLTNDVTLTLNDANGVFALSTTSMTLAEAEEGTAVTVTYAPTAIGEHEATVTIASTDAEAITVTLKGTAVLETYAPVMLEADTNYVTSTKFKAEWTDATPEANVESYTLYVNMTNDGKTVLLLSETFAGCTGSSDGNTDISNSLDSYTDSAGWTGTAVYTTSGGVKLGGSKKTGYIISPTLSLGSVVTVRFNAKYYNTDGSSVIVSCGDVSDTVELKTTAADYTVVLTGCSESNVKFATTAKKKRVYLYSVDIYNGDASEASSAPARVAAEEGDSTYRVVTGITPDKFYTVTGLIPGATYEFKVKAIYVDGAESEWSNIESVTLPTEDAALMYDINMDGYVNSEDVTTLIDYLLGNNPSPCYLPACDVDGNGIINNDDVTALIDYLLGVGEEED